VLPRHVRHEGLRQIEHHLAHHHRRKPNSEIATHTLGREHAKKVVEIDKARAVPDANIPKVVSFPAT
jgi:hypothetical protein